MIPSFTTECSECKTRLVVVPPTIGKFKSPTDEPERVELPEVPEGGRLVEADEEGRFVCPTCGTPGEAPDLGLG